MKCVLNNFPLHFSQRFPANLCPYSDPNPKEVKMMFSEANNQIPETWSFLTLVAVLNITFALSSMERLYQYQIFVK